MASRQLGLLISRGCSTFSNTSRIGSHHKVSGSDKYLLVFARKFPSLSEVPSFVSIEMMEKARSKGRIALNMGIFLIASIGCVWMAFNGKLLQAKGGSLNHYNHNWHEQYNQTHKE
ncbi:UPF0389 protein CG9231-like [Artemia franciscana]|uniref:UPF0389 protein CG9231-like n=1 Tax=Artemia franciscana TaxID=6661 RepID=UPI0032DA8A92